MCRKEYALAIDLDGTVLDSKGRLTDYTKEVFTKAISEGYELVVASGRALESLPEEVRTFPGIRYAITSNGAAIHDFETNTILKSYTLSPESVQAVITCMEGENIVYEAFIRGDGFAEKWYVEHPWAFGVKSESGIRYVQSTRKPVEDMKSFLKDHIYELDCIDVVLRDTKEKARLWEVIKEQVPDVLITTSVGRLIEIADLKAGKGNAFLWLLEKLQISVENTAAFGNAENDIDMMKAAAIGYAVANADEPCLMAADQILKSNDEDGVAIGIMDLMSRKERK